MQVYDLPDSYTIPCTSAVSDSLQIQDPSLPSGYIENNDPRQQTRDTPIYQASSVHQQSSHEAIAHYDHIYAAQEVLHSAHHLQAIVLHQNDRTVYSTTIRRV